MNSCSVVWSHVCVLQSEVGSLLKLLASSQRFLVVTAVRKPSTCCLQVDSQPERVNLCQVASHDEKLLPSHLWRGSKELTRLQTSCLWAVTLLWANRYHEDAVLSDLKPPRNNRLLFYHIPVILLLMTAFMLFSVSDLLQQWSTWPTHLEQLKSWGRLWGQCLQV